MKNQLVKDEDRSLYSFLLLFLALPTLLWSAFVFSKLWLWFVVPLGLIELQLAHAVGIILLLMWTKNWRAPVEERWADLYIGFTFPLFLLLFGWVAERFLK